MNPDARNNTPSISFQCSRTFLNIPISGCCVGVMDELDHTIRPASPRLLIGQGPLLLPSHWLAPAESLTSDNQISLTWELSLLSPQCTMYLHFSTLLFIPFIIFKKKTLSKVIHNIAILEKYSKGSDSHSPPCSLLTPASLRIIHPTNIRLMRQLAFTPTNIQAKGSNLNITT